MAGTSEGGLKAKAKNLSNDPDYYKKLSSLGGKSHRNWNFSDPEFARMAAQKRWISQKNNLDNNTRQE